MEKTGDPELRRLEAEGVEAMIHKQERPLTKYITQLYAFCDLVNDALATITTAMRTDSADWKLLAPTLDAGATLFAEDVRRAVRDSVHGLGVDFSNHVEPLRNLPNRFVESLRISGTGFVVCAVCA